MKIKNRNQESGRSMVEIVGVLAIMGLLTAAAFALIQSGMTSQKMAKTADEINILVENVRAISGEKGDFSNLPASCGSSNTSGKMLAAAILDPDNNNNTVTATMGGTFMICKDASDSNAFFISIYNMKSKYDCQMMEARAYSGGTATCSGKTLSIRYTK